MYIGSTGLRGLHHLVYEVVDNSVDEALAGHCDAVEVTIHPDNSVTVVDNGRGIPVAMHEKEKRPAVEVVLTVLHSGGKFGDGGGYKVSGGLHGVGVSVVNALSEHLAVEVRRDGHVWTQEGESEEGAVEVAMQWNSSYQESIFSFANNINTHEGGSHLSGFRSALTRTLNRYAREKGLLKDKDDNLAGEDVREGLTAVISAKLRDPQFEGQTKTKLG